MLQGDAVLVCSCSRHVNSDWQSLWQFLLAGILHDQNVITWRRQTPSQLDADLQQKREKRLLKLCSCYGFRQADIKLSGQTEVWLTLQLSLTLCVSASKTNTHTAQTFSPFPLSYIVATADGHVGVLRGDLLSWAGAWQVVVVDAVGIVAGHGGEGVQRQISVQQTARQTQREQTDRQLKTWSFLSVYCVLTRRERIN